MRWVVGSGSRRMARNALRLEAQDFMREFRLFLGTREALPLNAMPDRPPGSEGLWQFCRPLLSTLKLPFRQRRAQPTSAKRVLRTNQGARGRLLLVLNSGAARIQITYDIGPE
jgi:hypothetical protein